MKAETYRDLIDWTAHMHEQLAFHLEQAAKGEHQQRTEWLMRYLADHERLLHDTLLRFEQSAAEAALESWVYDYVTGTPGLSALLEQDMRGRSFDDVCALVFELHNQAIELYRYLQGRAETAEGRELMTQLLALEEHETLRLADQSNFLRDI